MKIEIAIERADDSAEVWNGKDTFGVPGILIVFTVDGHAYAETKTLLYVSEFVAQALLNQSHQEFLEWWRGNAPHSQDVSENFKKARRVQELI